MYVGERVEGYICRYMRHALLSLSLTSFTPPPSLSLTHTHTLLCTHPPTSGGTGGRQVWDWLEAPSLHLGPEGGTRTGNYCTAGKIWHRKLPPISQIFLRKVLFVDETICKKREAIGEHFYCEITTKYICLPLLWCRQLWCIALCVCVCVKSEKRGVRTKP